jgi:hypothetical protein
MSLPVRPENSPREIWFPAKRYGWGWGLPCRREGWLVLAVYVALLAAGARLLTGVPRPGWFVGYVAFWSTALLVVCRIKGETPRWRWGDR